MIDVLVVTHETPQLQFVDRVVDVTGMLRLVSTIQKVEKTGRASRVHYNDKVVNVPAVTQILVPVVELVQRTVEVPQMPIAERPYAVPQAVTQECPRASDARGLCACAGGPASSSSANGGATSPR